MNATGLEVPVPPGGSVDVGINLDTIVGCLFSPVTRFQCLKKDGFLPSKFLFAHVRVNFL